MQFSASLVLYKPDLRVLDRTLKSLSDSVNYMQSQFGVSFALYLVDNSANTTVYERVSAYVDTAKKSWPELNLQLLASDENIGYGKANNLIIHQVSSDYHLVINPDVVVDRLALADAVEFMQNHPDIGLLLPDVFEPSGQRSYLCKRYPTVLDLLLRGFVPRVVAAKFERRLHRYEMRDVVDGEHVCQPEIGSGCFMFFRTNLLKQIGGFDPRYFLYFEDYDISIRLAKVGRVVQVPSVRIVHAGGDAASKGLWHIWLFTRSGATFFHGHGWRWW